MNFDPLIDAISGTKIEALLPLLKNRQLNQIKYGDFPRWQLFLSQMPNIETSSSCFGDVVKIGDSSEIDNVTYNNLKTKLKELTPWRKGPFNIFGVEIDSEWRCEMKWHRLKKHIRPLAGRKVLDVGSGNGYFGFRMIEQEAELVIGLDPHIPYVSQFWALKTFLPNCPNFVLPYGLEQIPGQVSGFDTIFSMGVIYHRKAPIDHLLQLRQALCPGGELVLETLCVDGPTGYCLTPEQKYARMPNVWFIPSLGTIENWLSRCGFKNIRALEECPTHPSEQRRTDWMPFQSLADGLKGGQEKQTIEGYPAPTRVIVLASLE
ncbi:MAG: tRNA 5-methoxyuridine(34)/uridine 5-oxyacetic acid(34) synthase CmoB [Gammaproteobacteria bacterium]|nr:tRNA 5-methoxyuridine(34)/uridine 5-oxyacetic acid(34) synthase CmoB [Gammaproteobacteria bacterium]